MSEKDPLWNARLAGRVAFTWPGDELALGITPLSPEQLQLMSLGEAFYPQCAACHGNDGSGTTGLAPALAGAGWVTGCDGAGNLKICGNSPGAGKGHG